MAPDLQQFYEDTFSTMATPGWTALVEDLTKIKANINNIYMVKDAQNLSFRQGQLDILDFVLNRKAACEQAYEELSNEENV